MPKVPDVLVPSLRDHRMRALLAAASRSRQAARDRALVTLLLDSGIRLGELTALRVRDVDLVEGRCLVRGKGARERLVPIGGRCRRALRSSLLARGRLDPAAPLFVGRGDRALPRRTVQQLVRRFGVSAGLVERCSPHVLRHSFARAFLANGGDVFSLQRILGHSPASLQVTRRYVRLIDDDLRAWVGNLRAAGEATITNHGRRVPVRAIVLPPDEAGAILRGALEPIRRWRFLRPLLGPC